MVRNLFRSQRFAENPKKITLNTEHNPQPSPTNKGEISWLHSLEKKRKCKRGDGKVLSSSQMQTLFLRKHAQLLFACLTFAKQELLTKLPPRPCIICVYGLPHMQPAAKIKQRPDRSQGEQKLLRNVPPGLLAVAELYLFTAQKATRYHFWLSLLFALGTWTVNVSSFFPGEMFLNTIQSCTNVLLLLWCFFPMFPRWNAVRPAVIQWRNGGDGRAQTGGMGGRVRPSQLLSSRRMT